MQKEVKDQVFALLLGTTLLILAILPAANAASADHNICGSVWESRAYQQYRLRPDSNFSKLIYLIDHFSVCDIEIVYDGHYFKAPFVARVARWFLATHYKKETTKEWILRWCSTTIPQGTPIYVKLPNGKFRLAREVLTEQLEELDRAAKKDEVSLPSDVQLAPLAQLMVKSPATGRIQPSR